MATFYSKNTGNWEDGANWSTVSHTGAAGASPGTIGVDYPGSADTAIISAGHTITVTTNLSGIATAVTLNCDNPGTNTGTLAFSQTANTGLKANIGTINGASTFNIQIGTRTQPIQAGNTCNLVSTSNFRNNGLLNVEVWGKHREHANSDVYCDILTANASAGASTITVNGDVSPQWAANDWVFIVERATSSTSENRTELVQVDSYNSGTKVITLKTPLRYAYTTTNAYVFKAATKLVNTILSADHASGTDFVLEDDLYPGGAVGGSFLVRPNQIAAKANAVTATSSSYNSGTKTLTASGSVSQVCNKGSVLLMDDLNVKLTATSTTDIGGQSGRFIAAYCSFDTWNSVNYGADGQILFNLNLIDCRTLNGATITGNAISAYGVAKINKSTSASATGSVLRSSAIGSVGHKFFRCLLTATNDSSSTARVLNSIFNSYFDDCVFDTGGNSILFTGRACYFKNCSFGNIDFGFNSAIEDTYNCTFQDCFIYGARASNTNGIILKGENRFNNIVFGETKNGKINNNSSTGSIGFENTDISQLFNGVRFATGETEVDTTITTGLTGTFSVHFARYNNTSNQFKIITPGGNASHDASVFRTASPSIKFTHSNVNHPVFFDIAVYLTAGSRTLQIYTNPSTGSWTEAPQMFLIEESALEQIVRQWQDLKYVQRAVQSTLTTSTWTALSLSYTVPADGIYHIRLWAKNGSGTVNWDDFTVA